MRGVVVLAFALSHGVAVADELAGPLPEASPQFPTKLDLPAIPKFEFAVYGGDVYDPTSLRVQGRDLLDKRVTVKGYVVWIYDCVKAIAQPGETPTQTQKRIDDDPTLCERAKFYLGSRSNTPPERALWVVDVPRPPYKLEKERLPKRELAKWPKVPKVAVGDFVQITGTFTMASPHSERNSDGLLVYSAFAKAKPQKPKLVVTEVKPAVAPKPTAIAPQSAPDPKVRNASFERLAAGNKAAGLKQFDTAVTEYKAAIDAWSGNHLAWYGLGGAHAQRGDWRAAADAFEHALALSPKTAMYQMWTGIALYEAAVVQARIDQAKQQARKPEEIKADLSRVDFEPARIHLDAALALEPHLWRAHHYLGRIYRERAAAKQAATHFTRAIEEDRNQQGPYIALAELYRKWDYTEAARDVALIGTRLIPSNDTKGLSDAYYVLAMAYDDVGDYDAAIEAFTQALTQYRDNAKASFQRGQAYFKVRKYAEARADLETFLKTTRPDLEFAKQQAAKMLADMKTK